MKQILIYSSIGSDVNETTAKSIVEQLQAANGEPVLVRINSDGGEVTEGVAIYNALKGYSGGVDVSIDGIAASIASLIAMAGRTVTMADNAYIMVHLPSGVVGGNSDDMRNTAVLLDSMTALITRAYMAKTGLSEGELINLMKAETWLSATEAVAQKFADCITDKSQAVARLDVSRFKNAPRQLVDTSESDMSNPVDYQARASELTASLTAETALRISAQGQAQKNFADYTGIKANHDALVAQVADFTAKVTDLTAKLAAAETAQKKAQDALAAASEVTTKAVNQKANDILAAAGHKPLNLGSVNLDDKAKTMTRADFERLPVAQKSAAMRSGVKLTD